MKQHHFRRVTPPLWCSLLALVFLAGFITLFGLWCQPCALRTTLRSFWHSPLLIVLNALPVGLFLLGFSCLMNNVFYGAAFTNVCVGLLSIANRIKIEVRDEPVFPRDLLLLRETGSVVKSYHITYPIPAILLLVLFTFLFLLLGYFLPCRLFSSKKAKKTDAEKPAPRRRFWLLRILGLLLSAAVFLALIFTVYASNALYQSFPCSNSYYVPAVFNDLGFPYCFCHHFTTYAVDKPQSFSKSEAEAWETGEKAGLGKTVNVIMVMNEAFSDITDSPALQWNAENEPLHNFHALQKDPHAISGHIVVPGFAGGTANTEFDVLTGIQTTALSALTTSSMRVVNRNLDSLFRVFAADGYRTSFYHPGEAWFYNRENVYRWLGAENTVFAKDMENAEYKGRWVTDAFLAGQIKQEFETAVGSDQPLFLYATTIQNHMSYTPDKYGADHSFAPVFSVEPLSENTRELLSVYTEGVRDADAMLGSLTAYFSGRREPVILVFFGDHLPYLSTAYDEIGFTSAAQSDPFLSYETPFLLWANDAAADLLDFENASEALQLPSDHIISAAYLGQVVLELTGRRGENPWFDFLSEVRREAPVVQSGNYALTDGSRLTQQAIDASEDSSAALLRESIRKWRCWSYYKLKYQVIS